MSELYAQAYANGYDSVMAGITARAIHQSMRLSVCQSIKPVQNSESCNV